MASANRVILVGNVGRQPEVSHMANGDAVAKFSIATTDTWKDKSGERHEKTEWHSIIIFRRLGEVAGEYLKKGSMVYLEGRLQTRKGQDKNGQDRYTTEIVCHEMKMLGGKGGNGEGRRDEYDDSPPPPPARRAETRPASPRRTPEKRQSCARRPRC